ncbi:hypothetical protein CRG98_015008 [Punica granatum]|uniref:Uncharacterized protein n=1 Tax=Punica granatum TaxID=22663 RepID=A0A2I0KA11_PUNGR|nr:hypothetical protein CRG98_015008 [Punica granatum]
MKRTNCTSCFKSLSLSPSSSILFFFFGRTLTLTVTASSSTASSPVDGLPTVRSPITGFLGEDKDLDEPDDDVVDEDNANSASISSCPTMDKIGEELRLVCCKKEGLREAFELQWKEMEEHFDSIAKNLDDRLGILESKEKELGSMERRPKELGNACMEKEKEKELSSMKTWLKEVEAMLASSSLRMPSSSIGAMQWRRRRWRRLGLESDQRRRRRRRRREGRRKERGRQV